MSRSWDPHGFSSIADQLAELERERVLAVGPSGRPADAATGSAFVVPPLSGDESLLESHEDIQVGLLRRSRVACAYRTATPQLNR